MKVYSSCVNVLQQQNITMQHKHQNTCEDHTYVVIQAFISTYKSYKVIRSFIYLHSIQARLKDRISTSGGNTSAGQMFARAGAEGSSGDCQLA